jgi:sugar/nucleoside kinase (ribokinase family)
LPRALRYGAAVAALKYTVPGDMPLVDAAEAHQLAETGRTARLVR